MANYSVTANRAFPMVVKASERIAYHNIKKPVDNFAYLVKIFSNSSSKTFSACGMF
jgi:hypothetical protein